MVDESEERRMKKDYLLSASCEILRGDVMPVSVVGSETLPSSLPATPAKKKRSLASRFRDRIRFRKKSKSVETSGSSSPKPPLMPDMHTTHLSTEKEGKPRSSSEMAEWTLQQQFSPLVPTRPRSYTKLTSHIMEKYRVISSQHKHREARTRHHHSEADVHHRSNLNAPSHDPIHALLTSSSVEVFKRCLVFKQLKYKLAIALQNVHMPLPELKVGQSSKNQLVTILKSALQRCMWLRESSEVSLLQEIFKILEPLGEQQ